MTGLAAVPLVLYGLDQGELQRTLPARESHTGGEHWADMAKLAFAIPLVAVVASLRSRGSRIAAWSAAAAAALIGTASIVYPNQASSLGRGWGTLALAGGLLFVAVAEWEAKRRGTARDGELRATPEPSSRRQVAEALSPATGVSLIALGARRDR